MVNQIHFLSFFTFFFPFYTLPITCTLKNIADKKMETWAWALQDITIINNYSVQDSDLIMALSFTRTWRLHWSHNFSDCIAFFIIVNYFKVSPSIFFIWWSYFHVNLIYFSCVLVIDFSYTHDCCVYLT